MNNFPLISPKNDPNLLNMNNYLDLLKLLKIQGYDFIKFQDYENYIAKQSFVILRHDVDFTIRDANKLAFIENQEGVKATYFVQLRSPLYNSDSSYAFNSIKEIHSLGHDIALHLEIQDLSVQNDYITKELDIFLNLFYFANSRIVSFHRVGESAKTLYKLNLPGGIMQTYEKKFFHDIAYFSDSGGKWRKGSPVLSEVFAKKKPMQILTHPMWWIENGDDPYQKLRNLLNQNREETIDLLEQHVISYSLDSIRGKI